VQVRTFELYQNFGCNGRWDRRQFHARHSCFGGNLASLHGLLQNNNGALDIVCYGGVRIFRCNRILLFRR
jgi:hypothetical protein